MLCTPGFPKPCAKALTFRPECYTAHLTLAEQLSAPGLGWRNVIESGQTSVTTWQESVKRSILPSSWRIPIVLRGHWPAADMVPDPAGAHFGFCEIAWPVAMALNEPVASCGRDSSLCDARHCMAPAEPLGMTALPASEPRSSPCPTWLRLLGQSLFALLAFFAVQFALHFPSSPKPSFNLGYSSR